MVDVPRYTLRLLATMIIDTLQPLIADRSTSWYSGQSLTTGLLGGIFIFGGALVYVRAELSLWSWPSIRRGA